MKLGYGQLWAVLFMYRVFTVMCSASDYSVNAFLGSSLSSVIQFAVLFPVIKYTSGIMRPPEKRSVLFALYFIFAGMTAAAKLYALSAAENFAVSPLAMVVLAGITVLFCSRYSISTCGRSAVILSGLFVFFTVILILMVSGNIRTDNISVSYDDSLSVTDYALKDTAADVLFPVIPVLSLFTEKNRDRGLKIYYASRLLLSAAVTFLGASVTGKVSAVSEYPFFSICSFSGSAGVQRTDVMFVISCVLSAVIFLTLCVRVSSYFLSDSFKHPELLSAAAVIFGGFVFRGWKTDNVYLIMCIIFITADILYIMQTEKEERRKEKTV